MNTKAPAATFTSTAFGWFPAIAAAIVLLSLFVLGVFG